MPISHKMAGYFANRDEDLQNHGAETLEYTTDAATLRLLGSSYVLLRDDFLRTSGRGPTRDDTSVVVLTFGSADEHDVTARALAGLVATSDRHLDLRVVVGGGYAHTPALRAMVAGARATHGEPASFATAVVQGGAHQRLAYR
jgi:spore coat polysaccharide biosynthesis predicted glycosyltransferase SpsG